MWLLRRARVSEIGARHGSGGRGRRTCLKVDMARVVVVVDRGFVGVLESERGVLAMRGERELRTRRVSMREKGSHLTRSA